MKAFSESSANTGRVERVRCPRARVQKRKQHRRNRLPEAVEKDEENIKEYLDKLQEIVPSLPKNKKISKVEVIDHVIDYIHELREALGLPQCCNDIICNRFSMEAVMMGRKESQQSPMHSL